MPRRLRAANETAPADSTGATAGDRRLGRRLQWPDWHHAADP
jgi:hypothetical protein